MCLNGGTLNLDTCQCDCLKKPWIRQNGNCACEYKSLYQVVRMWGIYSRMCTSGSFFNRVCNLSVLELNPGIGNNFCSCTYANIPTKNH